MIVVQSLSKVLGVPGVRIGFTYSTNTAQLAAFRASLPIWNMNSIAEKIIELVLKNRPELEASYEQTRTDRDDLCRHLLTVRWVRSVWRSGANFVLAELDLNRSQSKSVADELLSRHGIYVKEISHKFPEPGSYWRLAVRTPAEHDRLRQAMVNTGRLAGPT